MVRIVQESNIGELTIEEDGMRVSVRATPDAPAAVSQAPLAIPEPGAAPALAAVERLRRGRVADGRHVLPRRRSPGSPPFVEVGDIVAAGQTLCILEAMKLMNEVKSDLEAIVRAIHVDNAQPVEFGQVLFDLEPLTGRPLDAA